MPAKQILWLFFIGLFSYLQSTGQQSNQWQLSQQYTPPDVSSNNLFGNAVDIDGNYAIASAHRHSPIINGDTIKQAGAVYLFEKDANNQWNQAQKLTAPDAVDFDYFGIDVGISGSTAVIGAHYNSSDTNNQNHKPAAGAVYVFERDDKGIWQFWQKITATDRDTLDWFGQSLSINENRLIVGAPGKNEEVEAVGCLYYYTKNEEGYWEEVQKVSPPHNKAYIEFGTSLHFSEDVLVVGAPLESSFLPSENVLYDIFARNQGAAYIYEIDDNGLWIFSQRLSLDQTWFYRTFADAVGVTTLNNKSYVFIAQPRWTTFDRENYPNQGHRTGGVHMYVKSDTAGWLLQETLIPTANSFMELGLNFAFGSGVSVDSNKVIIRYGESTPDFSSGFFSADIFAFDNITGWSKISDINSTTDQTTHFGFDVAIDNNNIIAGAFTYQSINNSIFFFTSEVIPNILEIAHKSHPIIYPNPVGSTLYFNVSKYPQLKSIQINNMAGETFLYKIFDKVPATLMFNQPPGIYTIIATDASNQLLTQKIMKLYD